MYFKLKYGDRDSKVAEVRSILLSLDLYHADAPNDITLDLEYFDRKLTYSIQAFQQQRGLLVDGYLNEETYLALLESRYTLGARPLYYQKNAVLTGDDIAYLQSKLQKLGFYNEDIDGIFGSDTDLALRNYQNEFGLLPNGICDSETIHSLFSLGLNIGNSSAYAITEFERNKELGPLLKGKKIVLDPGLGGNETGKILFSKEGPISESDLLWDITVRTAQQLNVTGVTTSFTRSSHQNLTDKDRISAANAANAHLMLSFRCDKYSNGKAHGAASFYYGNSHGSFSPIGQKLANYVQRELVSRVQVQNCQAHEKTWDILRLTKMPTIQVFLGYLTSTRDQAILLDSKKREIIADAIVIAIKRLYLFGKNDQPTGTYSFSKILREENLLRDELTQN